MILIDKATSNFDLFLAFITISVPMQLQTKFILIFKISSNFARVDYQSANFLNFSWPRAGVAELEGPGGPWPPHFFWKLVNKAARAPQLF